MNEAIRKAADAHDVSSASPSASTQAWRIPSNVGKDGFHPSPVGHRRAAKAVLEALAQTRERARRARRRCA